VTETRSPAVAVIADRTLSGIAAANMMTTAISKTWNFGNFGSGNWEVSGVRIGVRG